MLQSPSPPQSIKKPPPSLQTQMKKWRSRSRTNLTIIQTREEICGLYLVRWQDKLEWSQQRNFMYFLQQATGMQHATLCDCVQWPRNDDRRNWITRRWDDNNRPTVTNCVRTKKTQSRLLYHKSLVCLLFQNFDARSNSQPTNWAPEIMENKCEQLTMPFSHNIL